MLFLEFFANFLHERVLGDLVRTRKRYRQTDGRTDGRTYTEGKAIYVSRRGRHIINTFFICSSVLIEKYNKQIAN